MAPDRRTRARTTAWIASALLATVAATAVAGAAGAAAALPAGPPAWVVAGTRITHYSAVATVGAGSYELVEDPNGALVDPVTGTHYRESFTAGPPVEGGTGSGDGYLESTVVAVDGNDVALSRTYYVNDPLTATMWVGSSSGERVSGARVDGLWIHPDLLATLRTGGESDVLVLHGPVTVAGRTYQAVSLVRPTAGAYAFFAYDALTGVQLLSALRMATSQGGPLQMSYTELRGVRQLTVPGIGAPTPDWVNRRPQLEYTGTYETANPLDPSSPPITSPFSSRVTFTDVGATYALTSAAATVTMGGVATSATNTGVTGGIGLYWWTPSALAAMTSGQVLDTDPVTGQTLTVSAIATAATGPSVTITGSLPGITAETVYDVTTGVMLGNTIATVSTGTTLRASLQRLP